QTRWFCVAAGRLAALLPLLLGEGRHGGFATGPIPAQQVVAGSLGRVGPPHDPRDPLGIDRLELRDRSGIFAERREATGSEPLLEPLALLFQLQVDLATARGGEQVQAQ